MGRIKANLLIENLPIKLFGRLKGKKKVAELRKCSDHKPIIGGYGKKLLFNKLKFSVYWDILGSYGWKKIYYI